MDRPIHANLSTVFGVGYVIISPITNFSSLNAMEQITMRNFQTLEHITIDDTAGIMYILSGEKIMPSRLALRREGSYIAISTSYGPMEIALRPRFEEFTRILARLHPVQGLQTTRQVGTGQAYLGLGLGSDDELILRPTIVADATGHICFNLVLPKTVREALYRWLPVEELTTTE